MALSIELHRRLFRATRPRLRAGASGLEEEVPGQARDGAMPER